MDRQVNLISFPTAQLPWSCDQGVVGRPDFRLRVRCRLARFPLFFLELIAWAVPANLSPRRKVKVVPAVEPVIPQPVTPYVVVNGDFSCPQDFECVTAHEKGCVIFDTKTQEVRVLIDDVH